MGQRTEAMMLWGWPSPHVILVSPALLSRLSECKVVVWSCARPVNSAGPRASDSLATVT